MWLIIIVCVRGCFSIRWHFFIFSVGGSNFGEETSSNDDRSRSPVVPWPEWVCPNQTLKLLQVQALWFPPHIWPLIIIGHLWLFPSGHGLLMGHMALQHFQHNSC